MPIKACPRRGSVYLTTWGRPVLALGSCKRDRVSVQSLESGAVMLAKADLISVRGRKREAAKDALRAVASHLVSAPRTFKGKTAKGTGAKRARASKSAEGYMVPRWDGSQMVWVHVAKKPRNEAQAVPVAEFATMQSRYLDGL